MRASGHLFQGVLAAFSTWLVLQVASGLFVLLRPQASTDVVALGAIHALVLGGAVLLMGPGLFGSDPTTSVESGAVQAWQRVCGLDGPRSWVLGFGALLGLLIKLPAEAIRALVEVKFPTSDRELMAVWSLLRHETWWQAAALFIVVGFTGPLLEEVFYRGVLFARLERGVGGLGAWLVSSALFAVSHPSVRDWPSLLFVGLLLGNLRRTGKTIWASLGAHVAFNCSTLLAVVSGVQTQTTEVAIDWGLVVGTTGLLAVAVLASRRIL